MASRGLQTYRRLNSPHAAGRLAKVVWVCTGPSCELHYVQSEAPVQCHCGGIEFLKFQSKTEASHWAQLRMLEKRGQITKLRRQVWYELLAYGPEGQPTRVGHYVADFVWERDGKETIGDSKPAAGVDDLAALKLRIMEAMGRPVKLIIKGVFSDGVS